MAFGDVKRALVRKKGRLGLAAATGLLLQLGLGWSPAGAEGLVIPWTVEQVSPGGTETCTETSPGGCDDFRASCRENGGGTTSTGNPLVSIINCVSIPPIPQ